MSGDKDTSTRDPGDLAAGMRVGLGLPFFRWLGDYLAHQLQATEVLIGQLESDRETLRVVGTPQTPWPVAALPWADWDDAELTALESSTQQGLMLPLRDRVDRPVGAILVLGPTLPDLETARPVFADIERRCADELAQRSSVRTLHQVVRETTPRQGEDFFTTLIDAVTELLGVDVAYVAELDAESGQARTLIYRHGEDYLPSVAYDLAGTPCKEVYENGESILVKDDVCDRFPEDELLSELGARSYVGVPFFDARGELIGHLGIIHSEPLHLNAAVRTLFEMFAGRAGAELARLVAEKERIELERRLLETQKLESLGLMAGGVAHDFNNLLVSILGNTSLALRASGDEPRRDRYLRDVETAARRARDLAQHLLAYSGKGAFEFKDVDLADLVAETTTLLKVAIPKQIALELELDGGLPRVRGDATQLAQVAMNLVMNAADAIGDAPGRIRVSTRLREVDLLERDGICLSGPCLSLVVEDDGCGMSEETLATIFDPFFTTKSTGRGLGLAAVHGIVRGHGGVLGVRSRPGHGTRFELILPAAEVPVVEPPAPSESPRGWEGRGRILLADDDPTVRTVASAMLEFLGHEVVEAGDGDEVLSRFEEQGTTIDCVLLDMNMPRRSGPEVFAELRRLRPNLRILVMSGYDEEDTSRWFSKQRPTGFLAKPFTLEDMEAAVRGVFGDRVAS